MVRQRRRGSRVKTRLVSAQLNVSGGGGGGDDDGKSRAPISMSADEMNRIVASAVAELDAIVHKNSELRALIENETAMANRSGASLDYIESALDRALPYYDAIRQSVSVACEKAAAVHPFIARARATPLIAVYGARLAQWLAKGVEDQEYLAHYAIRATTAHAFVQACLLATVDDWRAVFNERAARISDVRDWVAVIDALDTYEQRARARCVEQSSWRTVRRRMLRQSLGPNHDVMRRCCRMRPMAYERLTNHRVRGTSMRNLPACQ